MSVKSYYCKITIFLGIGFHFFFNCFGAKKYGFTTFTIPGQVSTQRRAAVRLPCGTIPGTAGRRNFFTPAGGVILRDLMVING